MTLEFEILDPLDIEKRSFELIEQELPHPLDEQLAPIIKRVIHTTADFEYADTLSFSATALESGLAALRAGETIVTDTNMVKAGINRTALQQLGCEAVCYMADEAIAQEALEQGMTRATLSMDRAARLQGHPILAIGNAPTALIRLAELIREGRIAPALIIGVPVGFVNVVQSKELIMQSGIPYIVARGRKGGSNVAAAIVNALMYRITRT
ncbi:precorrin-8X methylmutase [Proteiniclasticum sp. QWL-01]|uniref:precorrin-8X methylmutase n=1 Tax=Proteiniclasticum sp. QWL-01 TaxID=3036945 RepID=UPI002410363F|nr:precorrin-8X methylmutase [Proteiniclasticum sp. QWL-01]WFF72731.1 precorrin-8X methylmutase [Proteiniclasticum sp. QWL-01]